MRPCLVRAQHDTMPYKALFHQWTFESKLVDASPLIGGHPGGQVSGTFGIVESLEDGVVRLAHPSDIKFTGGIEHADSQSSIDGGTGSTDCNQD